MSHPDAVRKDATDPRQRQRHGHASATPKRGDSAPPARGGEDPTAPPASEEARFLELETANVPETPRVLY